ncbi:ABC transporter ATP-binding protein [Fictibacillus aquaticus]|uniref:Multidrug ABC transporter ATP-binding protein n=1 Tax=Fictibacillus aquaticus TaxID=2021314 RepID=A0A235FCV0_9BACL|nr:ABC transporter ATP-binding protein [Fictibacillus aquaticus]OYD58753.1 multidrug ABC transporter ATP-binding protein [Fictibacillus aquaticus]
MESKQISEDVAGIDQKRVFWRLMSFMRPYKKKLTLAFFLLLMATALELLAPLVVKVFIDDYLTPGNFEEKTMLLLGGGYLLLVAAAAAVNYTQFVLFQSIALNIIQDLRVQMYEAVHRLGLKFFDRTPVGSLVSKITNDTEAIKDLYVSVLSTFVQNIVYLLGIFAVMFYLNAKLALYCMILVPVILWIMWMYRKYSSRSFFEMRERLSLLNARLNESLQGMAIIQAYNQQKRMKREFKEINESHAKAQMKNITYNGLLLRPAVDVIYMAALVTILSYFGFASFQTSVEIGVVYAFINYLDRFFEPVNMMMMRLSMFQQAVISAGRVFQVMDEREMAPGKMGEGEPRIEGGRIEFCNVTFSYDGKQDVLHNISFTAEPGTTVALVGHTGSGKSSIISLLMRFYTPDNGTITIDGEDLQAYDNRELRSKIGLVLQDSFLFAGNIHENISMNRKSGEEVHHAAEFVQASKFIEKLPESYQTAVGERGSGLSSGQRQLISFARTMAFQPKILILDEATANIDTETEEEIQEALKKMRHGRTTIAIAHRLSTIQDADQILVLHKGKIAERGTHQELLRQNGLYHKMYLLQQGTGVEAI